LAYHLLGVVALFNSMPDGGSGCAMDPQLADDEVIAVQCDRLGGACIPLARVGRGASGQVVAERARLK
jgi:hypothetical protein